MSRILNYILFITVFILTAMFASCEDGFDYPDAPIKDGISTIDVQIGFKDFTPALDTRADGNALKKINTLWIVMYDKDRKFVRKEQVLKFEEGSDLDDNKRPDGKPSSEVETGHVKFKLQVANGYYYMYAVANYDLSNVDNTSIETPEELSKLQLNWESGDVTQNAEMFGWFINGEKTDDHGTTAPIVTISGNNSNLHAWVRRAASKLTIAFDTDNLKENIFIYLKSISVKDIPEHCYLDSPNGVGQDDYTLENSLVDGETIYFSGAKEGDNSKDNHGNWPVIASGTRVFGLYSDRYGKHDDVTYDTDKSSLLLREHDEAAPALYFYENMQPNGVEGTISDKRQDVNGENKQVTYPDGTYNGSHNDDGSLKDDAYTDKGWKDGMKWGSYIEIQAYYENNGGERPGKGDIVYRFMLGKDTKINYEAERNYHYRLTMKFNGNANDIDFHIDYEEEAKPGLFTPDTTYVSYLYNQPASTSIRATPKPGYDFVKFEAIILDNEWVPYPKDETTTLYNTSAWDKQVNNNEDYMVTFVTDRNNADYNQKVYKCDSEMANNTEFGFLSLREVSTVTHDFGRNGGVQHSDMQRLVKNFRNAYFYGRMPDGSDSKDVKGPLNWREFIKGIPTKDTKEPLVTKDDVDGDYAFSRTTNPNNGQIDYVGTIPLYTRAKTLDPWAVYSGANPFYEHRRYARIKFIAHYEYIDGCGLPKTDGDEYSDVSYTHVLQARRVDNPRGIYRRAANLESFDVNLCYKNLTPQADGTEYIPIISRGPWSAMIEKDPHGLVKLEANGQSATKEGETITGRTLTNIKFKYTPQKEAPSSGAYGAIIKVTYHNNSCVHKILVRQGYSAHELGAGTIKWSAFNVYDKDYLTKSPLSVGSFFRRYTALSYPILEENNTTWGLGIELKKEDKLKIKGQDDTRWIDIPFSTDPSTNAFTDMKLSNHIEANSLDYRLPTFDEITELGIVDNNNNIQKPNPNANDYNYAFGITYADGASGIQLNSNAYSYSDPNNEGKDSQCGVRGIIVYSASTGDNVFFPLGSTGHARRKSRHWYITSSSKSTQKDAYGMMRYGSLDCRLTRWFDDYRPMAWDLISQRGGAYWINSGMANGIAIDFNFGNYMGYYLNKADLYTNPTAYIDKDGNTIAAESTPDALPIKPVSGK